MEVLFKKPRKYTIDVPEGSKSTIVNTHTDEDGDDWILWIETDSEGSNELRTRCLSSFDGDRDSDGSIFLFNSDIEKLFGKK